jgi:hypothetical protein
VIDFGLLDGYLMNSPFLRERDLTSLLDTLMFYPLGPFVVLLVIALLSRFGYVITNKTNRRVGLLIWLGGVTPAAICFWEVERESAGSIDDLGGGIAIFVLLIFVLFWSASCGLGILARSAMTNT